MLADLFAFDKSDISMPIKPLKKIFFLQILFVDLMVVMFVGLHVGLINVIGLCTVCLLSQLALDLSLSNLLLMVSGSLCRIP